MENSLQCENPRYKSIVILIGLIGGLAGLMFGLDQGIIGGALPFIAKTFHADDVTSEWIVSSMLWGCVLGVILCAFIIKSLGRRRTLQISAVFFGTFSLLCALSTTTSWLITSRLLLGVGVGMATFAAPIYLSEIAPPKIRGKLISFYQLAICFGILLAQLIDFYFSRTENWRMMLGILLLPAVAMLIGFILLPFSPRWLYLVGKKEKAEKVLKSVRMHASEVSLELNEIKSTLAIKTNTWKLLQNINYRKVLFLGIILQTMQQWTGFNACIYYGPTIFKMAGFTSNAGQQLGTASTGFIFLLGTIVAILFVDNFGRRKLLMFGFAGMAASFLVVALIFLVGITSANSFASYIVLAGILLFVFGFGVSAAPVVWILCAEIFPLRGRDFGMALSTATNWIMCGIVGATFLTIKNTLGTGNTFLLYGILCFIFIFVTFILVPETKGITLEEIEENLMKGKKLRNIGV